MSSYNWVLERCLKFKTVPDRWDILTLHNTEKEARDKLRLMESLLDPSTTAKGGGTITAYRVRPGGPFGKTCYTVTHN